MSSCALEDKTDDEAEIVHLHNKEVAIDLTGSDDEIVAVAVIDLVVPLPHVSSSVVSGGMCCGCGRCTGCNDTVVHPKFHDCLSSFTVGGLPRVAVLNKINDEREVNFRPLLMPKKYPVGQNTKHHVFFFVSVQ